MQYVVTIGIPVYKVVDYIRNTIESALAQTFQNIEYLIIDDCGEDGSINIIEEMKNSHPRGKDIRIIYHDRNYGVSMSRNQIIDEARGKYLFFLDSDDIIEPYTIQKMVETIEINQAEIVYGSLEKKDLIHNTAPQLFALPNAVLQSEDEMASYAFANYDSFQISVCNCLMDISFLRKNNLRFIDTSFWEDLAFTYDMVVKVKRAVLLSDITYHYLCHPGSLSHYQEREIIPKDEIRTNIYTIDYLKKKCGSMKDKTYLPYLCYALEMNSFYIVSHIMNHSDMIVPSFSNNELRHILCHPICLVDILKFSRKRKTNIVLYMLGRIPKPLFVPFFWLLVRLKRII